MLFPLRSMKWISAFRVCSLKLLFLVILICWKERSGRNKNKQTHAHSQNIDNSQKTQRKTAADMILQSKHFEWIASFALYLCYHFAQAGKMWIDFLLMGFYCFCFCRKSNTGNIVCCSSCASTIGSMFFDTPTQYAHTNSKTPELYQSVFASFVQIRLLTCVSQFDHFDLCIHTEIVWFVQIVQSFWIRYVFISSPVNGQVKMEKCLLYQTDWIIYILANGLAYGESVR